MPPLARLSARQLTSPVAPVAGRRLCTASGRPGARKEEMDAAAKKIADSKSKWQNLMGKAVDTLRPLAKPFELAVTVADITPALLIALRPLHCNRRDYWPLTQ